jgi:hypothetical protein
VADGRRSDPLAPDDASTANGIGAPNLGIMNGATVGSLNGLVKLVAPPAAGFNGPVTTSTGVVAEAQAATANAVVSETMSHSRQRRRITVR